jgi:hypothetical protein
MKGRAYVVYLAVNSDKSEWIFSSQMCNKPVRGQMYWTRANIYTDNMVRLPYGTIERILGRKLTWSDDAVEIDPYSTLIERKERFAPSHSLELTEVVNMLQKARETIGDEVIVNQLSKYFDTQVFTWLIEELDADYALGLFDNIKKGNE